MLFQQWRELAPDFEYPGGELRAAFRARVQRGLDRVLATNAIGALLVVHKGVIRAIVESLTGQLPEREHPGLGEAIVLTRGTTGAGRSAVTRAIRRAFRSPRRSPSRAA